VDRWPIVAGVNDALSAVLITLSLLLAAGSVVLAVRDRPIGTVMFFGLIGLEVLLLVQLVVGVVAVAGGTRPPSTATFLGYGVGLLLIPPVATVWSLSERSRSSTLVITVATLAVPVMVARMLQMWGQARG
jgi:hypothetical protein